MYPIKKCHRVWPLWYKSLRPHFAALVVLPIHTLILLQELVRKGIPHHFRGIVWQLLCNAHISPAREAYAEYIKMTSPFEKVRQTSKLPYLVMAITNVYCDIMIPVFLIIIICMFGLQN